MGFFIESDTLARLLIRELSSFLGTGPGRNHEVTQSKEHLELMMIFLQTSVTRFAMLKEVFNDVEGMLHDGSY